uniref:Uncharacterized protein n=1 Tax=Knipowitschia caucasica TaxID=637954 RepID=A0AAV2JLN4_KNICA
MTEHDADLSASWLFLVSDVCAPPAPVAHSASPGSVLLQKPPTLLHPPSCSHPPAPTLLHPASCTHPPALTLLHPPSCSHPMTQWRGAGAHLLLERILSLF